MLNALAASIRALDRDVTDEQTLALAPSPSATDGMPAVNGSGRLPRIRD
jgi:hypothetical protein